MIIVYEELRKTLKIWLTYPLALFFWTIFPIMWVIPFIFQGQAFVGALSSKAFADLTGTGQYIPFVIIGAVVSTYMFSALYGIGNAFRMEAYWGTLEYLIGSPAQKGFILLGKAISEGIFSTLFAFSQLAIAVFLFGVELTITKVFPILLIMTFLLLALYGLGIGLAGLTLLIKESRGIIHSLDNILYLFSPIRYPVEVNPITRIVSLFIPLTYALIAIRGIVLLNKPFHLLISQVVILFLLDIAFLAFGFYTFNTLEKKVRTAGTIGHH
jgi:ABC-2 type transport system permease protein